MASFTKVTVVFQGNKESLCMPIGSTIKDVLDAQGIVKEVRVEDEDGGYPSNSDALTDGMVLRITPVARDGGK